MKNIITVKNLSKSFKVYKKEPGLLGSIKGLFKRKYSDIEAVDSISFNISSGEFVGFIGPNGAGKTTTLKMLSGLLYPSSGSIKVLGFKPTDRKREFLKSISLVMGQKNQLWWDLPAMDSFLLNKEIYEISDEEFKNKSEGLIKLLDLEKVINIPVRKLSLGERMKCELISALLHSPKVLFLDEPTIGLDVVTQKKLRAFLKEFNGSSNTAVILTSHNMDDVKELCKRIIVIDDGKIVYDGSLKSLMNKYVNTKKITITFSKRVVRKNLEKLGVVVMYGGDTAVLSVDRGEVLVVSAKLLKSFSVTDLDIKEIGLEEVVEIMFDGR